MTILKDRTPRQNAGALRDLEFVKTGITALAPESMQSRTKFDQSVFVQKVRADGLTLSRLQAWPLAWSPLSWLKNDLPFQPRFSGTIWQGQITHIPNIDALQVSVSPRRILKGAPAIEFSATQPALSLRGQAGVGRLRNVDAKGWIHWILGQFSTDVLQRNVRIWRWRGPAMSGPIKCQDGDFIAVLSGDDGQQSIDVKTFLKADGRYEVEINVHTRQVGAAALLPLYGFEPVQDGFRLNEQGRWR